MAHPVHILEKGADVQDIVNMAAVAVMDAQERARPSERQSTPTGAARAFSFL
jgi:malate dehydrogenase (oxaloacetate-decarboxylating)(NADP+)